MTLRIYAPNAEGVSLYSSDLPNANPFGPGMSLEKAENGVWEVTVGPVPGGTYRYAFLVDGLQVLDPRNPATSESNMNSWSLLTVAGSPVSDLQEVPHGAVAEVQYYSESLKRFRRIHVYTPPGYEGGSKNYPVLYLLHGATDSDDSWSTVGRAGLVLDNLIASGKAEPMIVVMPMGHTGPFVFGGSMDTFQTQMKEFATDFSEDVRPLVEERYRVRSDRRSRAIAGLSMGGAQTLDIAFSDLADYGYIGVFSSGVFGIAGPANERSASQPWEESHREGLESAEAKDGLRLLWFATGKDDFLLETTQNTVDLFKSYDFDLTYKETEGGHTWINWREHYLPEFAQLIFNDLDTKEAAEATASDR